MKAGFYRLKDLLARGRILDPEYFQVKVLGFNMLQYYQVRDLILQLQRNKLLREQLIKFECLLESGAIFVKS